MVDDATQFATSALDGLERDCQRLAMVEYEGDLIAGPAAPAIARAAEVRNADEIVVGSRGVGRVRALMGSVAHDVIHLAQCPVTVIPDRMLEIQTAPAVSEAIRSSPQSVCAPSPMSPGAPAATLAS
jgi:hypothetical protein